MAWESIEWACGHKGSMQLYGKMSGRQGRQAYEAGRRCFVCWLLDEWVKSNDPRKGKIDFALKIARSKQIRVDI